MKQIINSILDTDVYKLTMMNFYIMHYPEVEATYAFNNRNLRMTFNEEAIKEIERQIGYMSSLRLKDKEYNWIRHNLPFLSASFRQYLAAYRFNPAQITLTLEENGRLNLEIKGNLRDTVLWEVPLIGHYI